MYIACTQASCKCPTKLIYIERVTGCCRNSFTVYTNMNKLVSFIDIGFSNRFNSYFTCCFVLREKTISDFKFFSKYV